MVYHGPAFPTLPTQALGMELRVYMAAHAPEEIPFWFEPTGTTKKPQPIVVDGVVTNQAQIDLWLAQEYDKWHKARQAQWPGAWADNVLKDLGFQ